MHQNSLNEDKQLFPVINNRRNNRYNLNGNYNLKKER